VSFTVLGVDGLPVEAVEAFLARLAAVGRSPNTVAGYAHDLRDFVEWLDEVGRDFRGLSLEQLTEFFAWVARPVAARVPGVFMLPGTPAAVTPATLVRKRAALASFYRFHARRDTSVPALLGELVGPRATGPFVPMLVHTRRGRLRADAYSPVRIAVAPKPAATLPDAAVARLVAACVRLRDRFLLILLDQTGLRLGEALGLRHADLRLRAGEVAVVPRENVNGVRVKGSKARVVPAGAVVFDAYADYMETEYGSNDLMQHVRLRRNGHLLGRRVIALAHADAVNREDRVARGRQTPGVGVAVRVDAWHVPVVVVVAVARHQQLHHTRPRIRGCAQPTHEAIRHGTGRRQPDRHACAYTPHPTVRVTAPRRRVHPSDARRTDRGHHCGQRETVAVPLIPHVIHAAANRRPDAEFIPSKQANVTLWRCGIPCAPVQPRPRQARPAHRL
jgi:site-specific recombinase XerD